MRISDWSSDVCSSDLLHLGSAQAIAVTAAARRPLDFGHQQIAEQLWNIDRIYLGVGGRKPLAAQPIPIAVGVVQPLVVDLLPQAFCRDSSEARRVGKAGVSTCRSRWSTYHTKKK